MVLENTYLELLLILNGKMMLYLMEVKRIVYSNCFHNLEYIEQKMISLLDHNMFI